MYGSWVITHIENPPPIPKKRYLGNGGSHPGGRMRRRYSDKPDTRSHYLAHCIVPREQAKRWDIMVFVNLESGAGGLRRRRISPVDHIPDPEGEEIPRNLFPSDLRVRKGLGSMGMLHLVPSRYHESIWIWRNQVLILIPIMKLSQLEELWAFQASGKGGRILDLCLEVGYVP